MQCFEQLLQNILGYTCVLCKQSWRIPQADRAGTTTDYGRRCFSYEGPCILFFLPKISAEISPKQGLVPLSLQVNKMQSSCTKILSVREEWEIPKWPTTPRGRTRATRQQQDSGALPCRGTVPALQWPLVAPQDTYTCSAGSPRQQHGWARSSPAGICRDIFCCSGSRGKAGRGQWGMGAVKYWYWFWGCGWLSHHGCEFRLIDTGCIDREMHPQGWVSPIISQGYLAPSATASLGQLYGQSCCCLRHWDVDAQYSILGTHSYPWYLRQNKGLPRLPRLGNVHLSTTVAILPMPGQISGLPLRAAGHIRGHMCKWNMFGPLTRRSQFSKLDFQSSRVFR